MLGIFLFLKDTFQDAASCREHLIIFLDMGCELLAVSYSCKLSGRFCLYQAEGGKE